MNKKEFLKELEIKLQLLNENELKDIINEYSDTIDEKVLRGETEKEAVNDFGNIDELADEILEAYKINPNYKKASSFEDSMSKLEVWIKDVAKKLSDGTKEIFKNKDKVSVQSIFEVLIKLLFIFALCSLLSIPFAIIKHIGLSILDITVYPLNRILSFVWSLLLTITYFVGCVSILLAVFKKGFASKEEINPPVPQVKAKKEKTKVNINETVAEPIVKENKKGNFGKVLRVIFGIFVTITFGIPIFIMIAITCAALGFIIYMIFKGIFFTGVTILIVSILVFLIYLIIFIKRIFSSNKKIIIWPFFASIVFGFLGLFIAFDEVTQLKYYDYLPTNNFEYTTTTVTETINTTKNLYVDGEVSYLENNDLKNNEVIFRISYYKDYAKADLDTYENNIRVYANANKKIYVYDIYNLALSKLKEKEIYNYQKLYEAYVVVEANEKTLKLINGN